MSALANLSDLQRMELQINTLFCSNVDGRLRCVNELGEPPAPRFFMGRTRQGNLWRMRYDLPTGLADEVDQLCRTEPVADDLSRSPTIAAALKALLDDHAPIEGESSGPAYWIPDNNRAANYAVLITEANAACLRGAFSWVRSRLGQPDLGPVAAVIQDGRAVSICFCSRRPAQATEAGVETIPDYRGKGHATAVVARWSAEMRSMGVLPLYSTSWDNLASQAIARKLKMVQYGEDWSIQ